MKHWVVIKYFSNTRLITYSNPCFSKLTCNHSDLKNDSRINKEGQRDVNSWIICYYILSEMGTILYYRPFLASVDPLFGERSKWKKQF